MKSSKSIERLFQESFKDFQASPSPKAWKGIEAKLAEKNSSKRGIAFWWQTAAVAAILMIFVAIGAFYYKPLDTKTSISSQNQSEFEAPSQLIEVVPAQYRFSSLYDQLSILDNSLEHRFAFQISDFKSIDSQTRYADASLAEEMPPGEAKLAQRNTSTVDQLNPLSVYSVSNSGISTTLFKFKAQTVNKKKSLFDAIENDELLVHEENQTIDKPWAVRPNVAPVFMNSLNGGNPIEPSLQGKTSSNPNLSYGINVAYAIDKKIKIRTGINQVAMGYNTRDVVLSVTSSSFRRQSSGQLNLKTNLIGDISIVSATEGRNLQSRTSASPLGITPAKFSNTGVLNHELSFVEVPLEVEYAFIDKKIGLHILGGASTYLLNNNEIFFEENGNLSSIGEAGNLNTFSFSANLGVGMDYNFTDRVSFNLEPKFLYQINTFRSNTVNFQPYFFGIYSGIKFKF